ncbi:MAG: discoidin domain-containing protein [Bacteroidaceae bacterium]|nr:discoidin domain-containing protein [Bacteroidaceae bacterium]
MKRLFVFLMLMPLVVSVRAQVKEIVKTGDTTVEVHYADGQTRVLDFYSLDIVRIFQDPAGGPMRDPQAKPEAKILVDNPRKWNDKFQLKVEGLTVSTLNMQLTFDEQTGLMTAGYKTVELSLKGGSYKVLSETAPVSIENRQTTVRLSRTEEECFYGGGMQNGRFSHGGKVIQIVNTNNWTDGGVASPTPFFWSTAGYGILFHTFQPGRYDFGAAKPDEVVLTHNADYLDMFLMVNCPGVSCLQGYYQLTGNPVLLPKFGFYEGHLNAYNRDYWTETDEGGIPFEDGKRYKESQKPIAGGIRESLNGELTDSLGRSNYQFSARAVVDRYAAHDMPLGWVLPNDGYGAGYGQTGSLEGNIDNLRQFGDYAREHGVEIGLWTQSDLHPKEGIEPLLQRDIVGEVRDAGVRVLKTDVAWVGAGYSFGLNGVADVAQIMPEQGNRARPFIITLDGWAGTQRYAGLWSGDQVGGQWEYIRFHIPTYIGSGLSGQPNVGSDMDGIFGGKNIPVNVRDFQWKTFTPMELNMDGWGANEKYPHALGERAEGINRVWLKIKSMLMPYTYSIAWGAARGGNPMVQAMSDYLRNVEEHRYFNVLPVHIENLQQIDDLTKYQFMYGPYFLVAPIYQDTKMDADGNDIRNGIFLPEGYWYDPYQGGYIEGGCILNSYNAPLELIPFFIREGAVIPYTELHNQPRDVDYSHRSYFVIPRHKTCYMDWADLVEYDDDGTTDAYLSGENVRTALSNNYDETKKELEVFIYATNGTFEGFVPEKSTTIRIQASAAPKSVTVRKFKNDKKKKERGKKVDAKWTYEYGSLIIEVPTMDVTKEGLYIVCKGFELQKLLPLAKKHGTLDAPRVKWQTTAYKVKTSWVLPENADYAEIMFNGMRYTTLREGEFLFEDLKPETKYNFQIRYVNADGASKWMSFSTTTDANPLEFAIQGIEAKTSCPNQRGEYLWHLFDFDESTVWHTEWFQKAVPFTLDIDLRCTIQLDRLYYLPREDAGNGTLLEGSLSYSIDGQTWSTPQPFHWEGDSQTKELIVEGAPSVRYLRMKVTRGKGDFGSGRQLYVFRVPGTEILLPGDINHDGKVDMDDFTSYMNYTGLRKGDPDFDGYVSGGDINYNGKIDVYDISVVATQLRGGAEQYVEHFDGSLQLENSSAKLEAGEMLEVKVLGSNLHEVNAFGFALPYSASDLEFVDITPVNLKEMENLTFDRLHANDEKVLYPTFVNTGDRETLSGTGEICRIRFRARRSCKVSLKARDVVLVDKMLNTR